MDVQRIFDRVRRIAITTASLGSSRLALFGIELQEALERQMGNLVWLLAAFVFGGLSILLASILLLIVFWDTHRILSTLLLMLAYGLIALGCVLRLRHRMHSAPPAFEITLDEFKRDKAALAGKNGEAS